MKRTTIFLPDELYERLRSEAFSRRKSIAELIRTRLERSSRSPLAGARSLHAPGLDELPVFGKFHHASVGVAPVPVGHEDVAVGGHRHIAWTVERIVAGPGDSGFAQRHQNLPVRAELDRLRALPVLGVLIGRPDVALAIHREPVRCVEHSCAEALYVLAGVIELHNRRILAMEDPHVAVRIGHHRDHLPPFNVRGKMGPAFDGVERIR
ncbi:MAG TPA: CopG family transcriptional regulator [Bryobacteraceae bacterium]|nr:CopG family transcriptional regulator [Bryobacteraceae bacterium]